MPAHLLQAVRSKVRAVVRDFIMFWIPSSPFVLKMTFILLFASSAPSALTSCEISALKLDEQVAATDASVEIHGASC